MLTVGSLFSGIGGIDLGLERTNGFEIKWQVEIDEYCTKVLAKHWPNTPRFRDIRECGKHNLPYVDVICGGFPCQDISQSNSINPHGLDGERSGLWKEMYRIICDLRPRYALVENVSALLFRGMGDILRDLAHIGYNAEWHMLQASDFGLPHQRKRIFIIAYPNQIRHLCIQQSYNLQRSFRSNTRQTSNKMVLLRDMVAQLEQRWGTSSVCRADDGISSWLDRLGSVGNAVVPQIATYIGHCILEREAFIEKQHATI